jgi:adenylate cyclase
MMAALATHNQERARRGWRPLAHGIAVHQGPVVAGNIGTEGRANYTVVGDTVNLASRLESLTKDLGVSVLISEAAVAASGLGPEVVREVTTVTVRGRTQPVRVFTLAAWDG